MAVKGTYYLTALHGADDEQEYRGEFRLADLDTPEGEKTVELYIWRDDQECAIGAVHMNREELLDAVSESAGDGVVRVDASGWARFPEVVEYADAAGITVAQAIRVLVNSGLSHR